MMHLLLAGMGALMIMGNPKFKKKRIAKDGKLRSAAQFMGNGI